MNGILRWGEKALMTLAGMAVVLIAFFWLLNLARGLPGSIGQAADTVATHANGSAYGF